MTCTPDTAAARIAALRAENDAAGGWGAAVGARHEEVRALERIAQDEQSLRDANGVITDIAHATPAQLIKAADTIERLTRNPDLLADAKWAREIAEQDLKRKDQQP